MTKIDLRKLRFQFIALSVKQGLTRKESNVHWMMIKDRRDIRSVQLVLNKMYILWNPTPEATHSISVYELDIV